MSDVTRIEGITYETPAGEMTVTYDRPEWVVVDNGVEHRFASVPEWMGYARTNYGWPLKTKASF